MRDGEVLHRGWKMLCGRNAEGEHLSLHFELFDWRNRLALKRELSVTDWEKLIREIRAEVETTSAGSVSLYEYVSLNLCDVIDS